MDVDCATNKFRARRWRRPFRGDIVSQVGLAILVVLVALAVLGPWLPFGDPTKIGAGAPFESPSAHFWFGTDSLGRDQVPRVIEGIRTTFVFAAGAVVITCIIGSLIGMLAGYLGGVVGEVITRLADVMFAVPALLLAIVVIAVTGPGRSGAIISIVLLSVPMMIRIVRANTLMVVNRDYVIAARVGGASTGRILAVHILPSISGAIIVQGTYALSVGMLIESGLSFLGLGLQPPDASLGSLVNVGSQTIATAPWLVLIPGGLLALALVSVNVVGDGLRDVLDVQAMEARQ